MSLRECENDFLSRKSDTTCVRISPCIERTSGSHGKRVQGRTFNFPGRRTRLTFLLLVVGVSIFCQPVFGQSLEQPAEFSCVEGQNHERFPQCFCGKFAQIIPSEERQYLQNNGLRVFDRHHGRRIQYYVCSPCTICGDGIKVIEQCTQRSDTECSQTECQNPTWKFDFGSKSCKPLSPPRVPASTEATTTTRHTTVVKGLVPTTKQEPDLEYSWSEDIFRHGERDKIASFGTGAWLLRHIQPVVIGIIGTLAVLIILVVVMMVMSYRSQRAPASLQCSSKNTSSSSLHSVEVARDTT